jgi:hypothetical protein
MEKKDKVIHFIANLTTIGGLTVSFGSIVLKDVLHKINSTEALIGAFGGLAIALLGSPLIAGFSKPDPSDIVQS